MNEETIIHVVDDAFEPDDEAVFAETGDAADEDVLGTFDDNVDDADDEGGEVSA